MLEGRSIYQIYARARHEGYSVNDSVALCNAPQHIVFKVVSLYLKEWVEGMPKCLSDTQVVTLVWGRYLAGVERIRCERWVNRVRSQKVK